MAESGQADVSDQPAATRSTRQAQREESEPTPILVVDDDPDDPRYIRDTLIQAGYTPWSPKTLRKRFAS